MSNIYQLFKSLLPKTPLLVGTVRANVASIATIELPSGEYVAARGDANVGDKVFFRDGVIESIAPNLTVEVIEV